MKRFLILLCLLCLPAWANIYLGSYPAGTTNITFMFSTSDSAGGRVAPSSAFENADIVIASPGQSDCVGSTDADPLTIASPYNSKVGLHRVVIDASDNTCSSFFAAGRTYMVYLYPDETVDGQNVSALIAMFSIDREDITASRIAASAIGASELAADSITSSEIADNAIDAGAIAANAITSSELATDAIGAAQIAASAITSSEAPNLDAAVSSRSTLTAANVWDALLTGITTVGSIGKLIKDNLNAAITSRLASGTVAADVTAILADTAAMDTSGELRTLLFGSDTPGAIESTLTAMKGATFNGTTDSLEAIRDRGDAAWTTATGFSTLDAAGVRTAVGLAAANLDTQLADLPTVAEFEARTIPSASYFDPAVDTVAHVTLVDTTTTNTDMRGTDGAYTGTPPTASAIADQVWEEAIGDHDGTAGSTAEALAAVEGGIVTPATVADAVWDELAAAHTINGSFGAIVGALLCFGSGDIAVYDETGYSDIQDGNDNLVYTTELGVGIASNVIAYLTSDVENDYFVSRGQTTTDDTGHFTTPLMLDTGVEYTIFYYATGYRNASVEITVE